LVFLVVTKSFAATPPNTMISNAFSVTYSGVELALEAKSEVDFMVETNSPAQISFLQLASPAVAAADTTSLFFAGAACSRSGSMTGPFVETNLITYSGTAVTTAVDTSFLADPMAFSSGDPVFVRVQDFDQNLDASAVETVVVTVFNKTNGDSEVILLTETGPSTAVFVGGIQALMGDAVVGSCALDIGRDDQLSVRYVDRNDNTDEVDANALVDPFGVFFDAINGEPINDVEITLIDAATDLPAQVFSPNGIDSWPATLISGQDVVDSSGRSFEFLAGEYRFPIIFPGDYYYRITPAGGFEFPSTVADEDLQQLPNAPYVLSPASRGATFNVPPGPDIQIDVPLDPIKGSVYIQKRASTDSAAIGDFIAYQVTVTNEETFPISGLVINDKLPRGFRLQAESLHLDGLVISPTLADNGRDMYLPIDTLAAEQTVVIDYVVEITSGAEVNREAINYAQSAFDNVSSNVASAAVLVTNELFNDVSFLLGRVYQGSCDDSGQIVPDYAPSAPAADVAAADVAAETSSSSSIGISGAKIYLEDGRSVTTGSDGRWHFAGLEPGVHVLRLDEASLAEGYELVACAENSRNYNTPHSAFIDLAAGTLWRHDFVVKKTAAAHDEVSLIDQLINDRDFADVAHMPAYDSSSITSNQFEVMWPPQNHTPRFPSLKVAVQHSNNDKVQLLLNGRAVSPLNRRDRFTNPIMLAGIATWVGVDLQNGTNTLVINQLNKAGKVLSTETRLVHYSGAPYRAQYLPEKSQLSADGRTPIIVAVRLTDADGFAVRAGTSGLFQVSSPYQAWLPENLRLQNDVLPGASNDSKYVVRDDGVAYFPIDATTKTGRLQLQVPLSENRVEEIEAWVSAEARDWLLVGLAEGTTGYNTVTEYLENVEASESDRYENGRVAFFGKGRIPGDYLLTIAYDTAAESADNPDQLFGDIRPDDYYSVYGDESLFQDEAESSRKLYLKIERNQFFALFGDFQTGMSVTELSSYNRTLNGIKSEYKDANFEANVFAAETSLANIRDELIGKGITGPYSLSRRMVVKNSEQIELEIRDRFQTGKILSTVALSRGNDYDIDYDLGLIRFRQAISVNDPLLNPQFIVVNYETRDDREAALVAGGRGEISTADDRIELGVSYITEENRGSEAELAGIDLTVDITDDIELRSEYATSDNTNVKGATAWTINLQQQSGALTSNAYATEIEAGFGVGQQNASEESSRKIGADSRWRFNEKYDVGISIDQQEQLIGSSSNSQARINGRRVGDKTAVDIGYRLAQTKTDNGVKEKSELVDVGASYQVLPRLRLEASSEFAINEQDDAELFPQRNTVGAEWQVTDSIALVASQEITDGSDNSESTTLALRTSLWDGADMNIGVDQQRGADSTQLSAVAGFAQRAQLTDNISLDLVFDQGRDLSDETTAGVDDFHAASVGVDWRFEQWSWTNRLETRRSDNTEDIALRTAVLHQLEDGRSLISAYDWATGRSADSDTDNQTLSLGYADRRFDHYAVLSRLDLSLNETDGTLQSLRERKAVLNNLLNIKPWQDAQLSLAYSAKYVVTNVNQQEFSGLTDFVGAHYRHNIGKQWDIGLQASTLQSRNANNQRFSYGVSAGFSPVRDVWLELGYNFDGFSDDDFDAAKRSTKGVYFSVRLKFDEDSFSRVKQAVMPNATVNNAPVADPLARAVPAVVAAPIVSTAIDQSAVNDGKNLVVIDIGDVSASASTVDSMTTISLGADGADGAEPRCNEQTQSRRYIQLASYSDLNVAKHN
jgi:uncharacterized repeat protein (TIGR01451 family)